MASRAGDLGDMAGKGYVDMDRKGERDSYVDRLPPTSEARFETINTLPRIASKYKNSDRGFELGRMSERDPNFMISPSFGVLLSNEQKGFKPVVKGNVAFDKQKSREPMLTSSAKFQPNIYSYADNISSAL